MEITFNKISKPNEIFSRWEVLLNGQVTKFKIYGEQYFGRKNIYSIFNVETKDVKVIGSLQSARSKIIIYLKKGN